MDLNQKCEKLLCNMNDLYLTATQLSSDCSAVQLSKNEIYYTIFESIISTNGIMYQILSSVTDKFNSVKEETNVSFQDDKTNLILNDTHLKILHKMMQRGRLMNYYTAFGGSPFDIKEQDIFDCAEDFDSIAEYFMKQLKSVDDAVISDEMKFRLLKSDFSLKEAIIHPKQDRFKEFLNNLQILKDFDNAFSQDSKIRNSDLYQHAGDKLDQLIDGLNEISEEIDLVFVSVKELNESITNLQDVVTEKLNSANNSEEIEILISEFSDRCIDNIMQKLEDTRSCRLYQEEEDKLKILFGSSDWNKMDEKSQKFLITARVMYNQMLLINPQLDYSGVCLLVSKALELELKNRFYFEYLHFLSEKYSNCREPYRKYPKNMLKNGKPIREDRFTLGSVPYILRDFYNSRLSASNKIDSKNQLLDYCEESLFSGKEREEIWDILQRYAGNIDKVKNDYRNPASHAGSLTLDDAKACLDYVLDVEKILKKMLDSFDS